MLRPQIPIPLKGLNQSPHRSYNTEMGCKPSAVSLSSPPSHLRILHYLSSRAEFLPYDPMLADIAELLRNAIQTIGSTSVPGCGGKGIIDLAVLYPKGLLAGARAVLDNL